MNYFVLGIVIAMLGYWGFDQYQQKQQEKEQQRLMEVARQTLKTSDLLEPNIQAVVNSLPNPKVSKDFQYPQLTMTVKGDFLENYDPTVLPQIGFDFQNEMVCRTIFQRLEDKSLAEKQAYLDVMVKDKVQVGLKIKNQAGQEIFSHQMLLKDCKQTYILGNVVLNLDLESAN